MARSNHSLVQDKIGEMTECSICAEIFTNPKVLPCVHTFCLHCLENYGKDKQPGSLLVCPICRNEFAIPDGGLCKLPHNFFIGQMVEIRKLSLTPEEKALCNTCPEGEEKVAEMYCIDCEQILCERCTKSHKKTKHCMNHQVVELGSGLRTQEFKLRNSYCDQHPKELIKMYCHEHSEAICLICCVESHQTHRCVNIQKAAEEFTERLKADRKAIINRIPECKEVGDKLDKYKKEFTEEISKTEENIRDNGTKLKHLIDLHTEVLIQNLKIIRDRNLKAFEVIKEDVDRFTVMIDSFDKYSEELLSRGSSVDICTAANQMYIRANELKKLAVNCNGGTFLCDTVSFYSSNFLKQCKSENVLGELAVTKSPDRIINFRTESSDDKNAKEAIEVLKEEVVEEHIQLSEAGEALVQSIQWKGFIESLYNDNKSLEVTVMGPTVIAACTRNAVEEVRKRLNGFIDKHTILEKFLPMELGVVDVITKFLKEDFRKIVAELKECSGNIDTSKGEPGFVIKGNEAGVGKAVQDLHKLTDRIVSYDHVIDRPGIPAYFYSRPGTEVLRGIQLNRKVSIQLDNSQEQLKPQAVANDGSERCRVEVRPGKFMILICGDITKFKVDAIVNSTNEDLKHIGGVAAAISEAAGTELDEDCFVRIKLEGKLLPGQACVTRAGKLPCKKVIHAVGPRWNGGHKDEENILHMAVESSLTKADEESLRSIAMPSISTGIFGFPLDKATDIIVDAVKNYLVDNSSTTLQKVFFIDNDLRAVASLERKLRTIQAEGSPQHPEDRREVGRGRRMVAGLRDRLIPTREAPAACNITQGNYIFGMMQTPIAIPDARMQIQEQHEQRHPRHSSRIILSIYALSKKSIDDVLKDIEDIIKDYIIDKVLERPQDQESIAKLDPKQVERIKRMTEIYPVQIEVETGRLKRIRIRGPFMEVTSVIDQVHSIFQEAHKKEIMKMEDDWIATVAQWEYEDGTDFETYPQDINAIIERAFRDKKPYADWEEENTKYRLTFQTMLEECLTKTGTPPIKVRRGTKGNYQFLHSVK